ncbi:MAG TPA: carbamoyltransferase C-terminal domain-containing protein [Candidatus Acidoferrales bacterium]
MYILGLSAMGHDSAAALLGDSGIVAAMEESKLARRRAIGGIPREAIRYCLEGAGIGWRDVAHVAIASRPWRAWQRQASFRARLAPLAPVSSGYFVNKASGELGRELNNVRIVKQLAGSPEGRVESLDHHLCHAAGAFYASAFERALVVSLDEKGDGRAGFVGIGKGTGLREVSSIGLPHSLAWVYSQVTKLLGFRPHADEHKTQWLSIYGGNGGDAGGGSAAVVTGAATGAVDFTELFLEMLRREPRGPAHLNAKYFRHGFAGELSFTHEFYRRAGIAREPGEGAPETRVAEPLRAGIAGGLQRACEIILCEWLVALREEYTERSLCLAGGLFLNPLLVAAIEARAGFENVFVQPAAGNEGTALGAAWLVWHQQLGRARMAAMSGPYWGPVYSNEEIKKVLDNCKAAYHWCDSDERKLGEAVRLLQAGKIVAWFQGAAEFGPRALGNRSLLASPWAPYAKENLNDYVKHRESFRPFALAIPEERCAEYFECSANGRFLTTMAKANEAGRKLLAPLPPGFLLPDNLVRLHVVHAKDNPLFWKLLNRAGENAPAPILVNTSFNLFGEPLVVTPRDAVRSYFCSGADALVAGNFLLEKR